MAGKKKSTIKQKMTSARKKASKSGVLPYLKGVSPNMSKSAEKRMGKAALKKRKRK